MNKKIEIKELTSIRFLAAFHVVLFHNINMLGSDLKAIPHWLQSIIGYGYCGVTFFFILSGFILTYVYSDKEESSLESNRSFYYARFSRIYPIYLLAFIFDLPRGLSYFLESHAYGKTLLSSISHLLMLQSWHPRLATVWNSPGWSISTEAFFYFIFPFVLPYILKSRKNLIWISIFYLIPLIIYSTLTRSLHLNLEDGVYEVFWRSFPIIRMFEFLVGIFLGKMFLQNHLFLQFIKKNFKISGIVFWILTLGSLLIFTQNTSIAKSIFPNLILLPVFSLMILILTSVEIPFAFLLKNRMMVLLGSASYALYIFHRPMEPYIEYLTAHLPINFTGSTLLIYLIFMLIFSISIYHFIEMPIQKYLRQRLFSPKK